MMTSTQARASTMAAASRVGSRTSVLSGESVRATTFIPEPCGEAIVSRSSLGPPSASSRQLSATVRTESIASDIVTWPVTVSASIRRTDLPLRIWRVDARLVATVVLPTPPLGLKIAMVMARPFQPDRPTSPPCRTGPLPSSTVSRRMHMASTRQRIESAVYGRVKYSSPESPTSTPAKCSSARGETTVSAAIGCFGSCTMASKARASSSSISPSRTARATSRRLATTRLMSAGSTTSMTSKPAPASSAHTGADSPGGRATMTAGRTMCGLLGAGAWWRQSPVSGSCAVTSIVPSD